MATLTGRCFDVFMRFRSADNAGLMRQTGLL